MIVSTVLLALVASVAADVTCKTPNGLGPCIPEMPGIHACIDGSGCIVNAADDTLSYCCKLEEIVNDNCAPGVVTVAPPTDSTTCVDKLNPNTGLSDCPRLAYLCNDPGYFQLMTQECPKTCNRCPGAPGSVTTPACVDKVNPQTGVSECQQNINLCHNALYEPLMMDQCPKTCGFC